jgi:hypothetical protein
MATLKSSDTNLQVIFKGFLSGLGWMVGATLGFTILVAVLNWLDGLPIIGNFIAAIVEMTNRALETRQNLPR